MTNYNIDVIDNYLKDYNVSYSEMFVKYLDLINEFNSNLNNLQCISDINYFKCISVKGIETLTHVYRCLLLYTKNIDLTYHNCQKAIYYYIEFINQIIDSSNILNITINEAVLFVYKKTIFDIVYSVQSTYDNDVLEHYNGNKDNIFCVTELYLSRFHNILNNCETAITKETISDALCKSNEFGKQIIYMTHNNDSISYNKKVVILLKFNNCIINSSLNNKYEILKLISKKLKNINISLDNINEAVLYVKNLSSGEETAKQIVKMIFSRINCH